MAIFDGTVFRNSKKETLLEVVNRDSGKVYYMHAPKHDADGKRLRSKDKCELTFDDVSKSWSIYKRKPVKYTKEEWQKICKEIEETVKNL